MHSFIYLASQSPRRQELLTQIGVRFELLLSDSSEDAESLEIQLPNEPALAYVKRVTLAKLTAAKQRCDARELPSAPILCAHSYGTALKPQTAEASVPRGPQRSLATFIL
jgi:septum formation protein